MSPAFRLVVKWSRTVHLYLTLFALGLLLFFAVTGFMLNHEDWFLKEARAERPCAVPAEWVEFREDRTPAENDIGELNQLRIVERLRSEYAVSGALIPYQDKLADDPNAKPTPLEVHPEAVRATFKRPGRITTVELLREAKEADGKTLPPGSGTMITVESGANGVVMELHKGKDSSGPWKFVIDFVAVVYVVVSATGIIMWWSLKGRGKFGAWVVAGGVVLSVAVVVVFEFLRK